MDLNRLSKTLSHMLRHAPQEHNVEMDVNGFVSVESALKSLSEKYPDVQERHLEFLAEPSDKQRFEIIDDRIRATYGHSISVDLGYPEAEPPEFLYHGTAHKFMSSIRGRGLTPQKRQYVHMAETEERAQFMGSRKDRNPAILKINAQKAFHDGIKFYRGTDQTWLSTAIPPKYITKMSKIIKMKSTVVMEFEYILNSDYFHEGITDEEMIQIETESLNGEVDDAVKRISQGQHDSKYNVSVTVRRC